MAGRIATYRHKFARLWSDPSGESTRSSRWLRFGLLCILFYLLVVIVLAWLWNTEPDTFSVTERVAMEYPEGPRHSVTGVVTTVTLIHVAEGMLDKRGGYLSNDIFPPGVWMDNIPSWEYGVLIQVRDFTKAMREAFSRSQSQSQEDPQLAKAESRFNFEHQSWILPQTEDEYREGIRYLRAYLTRLTDEDERNAQFYTRADNLRYWLSTVETRLGSLSQNLSASVGQRRLNTDLAGDPTAAQSTRTPGESDVKTPWHKIDDVFYEARGSTWALLHLLKAIEVDFEATLKNKNALVSLQQIIRELEGSQQALYSPMILNGSGFGVLANHSLVMANYISRANAAIIDLRELLSRG